jgi:tRNA threonylcarbamoyladenosine biosynthesis protein TsaE
MVGTAVSESPHQTDRLGRTLGAAAFPGTVIALVGPLGAGKTRLAKGIARGLGVESVVNSPTFILMNEHPGRLRLFHVDLYRVADPDEALAAGVLDERQASGVTVIEWADRLDGWLPSDRLDVRIEPAARGDPQRRLLAWRAHGSEHGVLAARLAEAGARLAKRATGP